MFPNGKFSDSYREIQKSINRTGKFKTSSDCYREVQESKITTTKFEISQGVKLRVIYFFFSQKIVDFVILVEDCRVIAIPSALKNFL